MYADGEAGAELIGSQAPEGWRIIVGMEPDAVRADLGFIADAIEHAPVDAWHGRGDPTGLCTMHNSTRGEVSVQVHEGLLVIRSIIRIIYIMEYFSRLFQPAWLAISMIMPS